jgi:signal transduction histidine kinase
VQEVVTNTLRHAGARTLSIALKRSGGGVSVEARDDGRGAAAVQPGSGLAGMRERIEQAGGRLQVESAAGAGFAVRAWLPA